MLLSKNVLREQFAIEENIDELAHRLTMAGLEVDDIKRFHALPKVVIAEVTAINPHPDADKLRIATVNNGQEILQIVCGAPNLTLNSKVPLAMIGAELPNGLKIKQSKLRGIESQGMLCSAFELGLSEVSEGLLILPENAPLGMEIHQYLQLDDEILEINITPNRADCFSWRGLAREIAVLYDKNIDLAVKIPNFVVNEALPAVKINNQNPQDCPKYLARRIKNIDNQRETPEHIKSALERNGIRTHNPVVDVTNYVMMLLGTPLHAFDAQKIQGTINIRNAHAGEKIHLLNDNEYSLNPEFLVIADEKEALAVAGVMGNLASSSTENSSEIILESAFFQAVKIAGKARALNLSSDSAQRFERGVDFELQRSALDLASALIIEICGGEASILTEFCSPEFLPKREVIKLNKQNISKRLGHDYSEQEIEQTLSALECKLEKLDEQNYAVIAPSWRFDLQIEVDLIEEIARVIGYENIPDKQALFSNQALVPQDFRRKAANILAGLGYNEAITYSFLDEKTQNLFFPENQAISLQNPISNNLAVMRLGLIPSLVQALQYNRNRQEYNVRLFEIGRIFTSIAQQDYHIAGVLCGLAAPEKWQDNRNIDFYDTKATVQALLAGKNPEFKTGTSQFFHPNKSASVHVNGKKCGELGALHPQILASLGIKNTEIYAFELEADCLENNKLVQYQPLAKFPSLRRDIALLFNPDISVQLILDSIKKEAGELLQQVFCFDIYQSSELGDKKSVALALILQAKERTLHEEEIEIIISNVIKVLSKEFGAELR